MSYNVSIGTLNPTVAYHLGHGDHPGRRGLDLPWLVLRSIEDGPLRMACRNGKEGWGVYPGVDSALLLPFQISAGSACV